MSYRIRSVLLVVATAWAAHAVFAGPPKSWREEGLMQGFPPAAEKRVDKSNWLAPPFNRWAFQNISGVHNTAVIPRGRGPVSVLPRRSLDLDRITYKDDDGKTRTFREMLDMTYTDGIVILRDGAVVYEKYFNGMTPQRRHILFSATKSLCGTMAATLAHRGGLDPSRSTSTYIPELKGSAFGDTTVRQIMDMTTGIAYSEAYHDMKSEVVAHVVAAHYRPFPDGYTGPGSLQTFLPGLKKKGEHGHAFHYVSANTEALGWLVERSIGRSSVDLFAERIWSKLGAERDGLIIVDRAGFPSWGCGFACTTRDFARFGLMIANSGIANGYQCVPAKAVEGFSKGGDRTAFSRSAEGKQGHRWRAGPTATSGGSPTTIMAPSPRSASTANGATSIPRRAW